MEPPSSLSRRWGLQVWERSCIRLGGMGCSGADEHTFPFEGVLEGGTDPGADVDVTLGAQTGQGVVEVWREPDQQGFVFHLVSEYIAGPVKGPRGGRGRRGVVVLGTASLPFGATLHVIPDRGWSTGGDGP